MKQLVDWAVHRARMVLFFVVLSLIAGIYSYTNLPKEGEPDIEIPVVFISVPFQGISAEDSEALLVKPLEKEFSELKGLKKMSSTAAESYAGIALEFDYNWNRESTLADIRDKANKAENKFPDGAEQYSINEINFSEFPIVIVTVSGNIPERTLTRVSKDLQTVIEAVPNVLETGLSGVRDEMVEVLIDPLKLELYNVTAGELYAVVNNNNQLIAAGDVEVGSGSYSIKIPSSFKSTTDVYDLPIKINGDRVIRLGDIAEIKLTFKDRFGMARFNGQPTMAIQVVKRKGSNLIQTVEEVKDVVNHHTKSWPVSLRNTVVVNFSLDNSKQVKGMVDSLESAVLTAIALVMIVVLASLGTRSALLVGFAIPTSFMLTFAFLAIFDIAISNIVMFGLILAVGMLVDGAIIVVEYADKEIKKNVGPMRAYTAAAKRMFWPIISSTATTLCAFLPMLFWPGVAGQFMGNLPLTIIFVLSASLIVVLIYLPVVGGVTGRVSRNIVRIAEQLRVQIPFITRVLLFIGFVILLIGTAFVSLKSAFIDTNKPLSFITAVIFCMECLVLSTLLSSLQTIKDPETAEHTYARNRVGKVVYFLVGNPFMPVITILSCIFLLFSIFKVYQENSKGVEFFVATEFDQALAHVRARGNLSVNEKDRLVRMVEQEIIGIDGVEAVFAFTGPGGFTNADGLGDSKPTDTVGGIQIELASWDKRRPGKEIVNEINERLKILPGVKAQISEQIRGPSSPKPVFIRVSGSERSKLLEATSLIRKKMDNNSNLKNVGDTRPLPGIDWQFDVDVEAAGRYGTDVSTIGGIIQLVTKGIKLGAMRIDSSDEELDIRVRFPEKDRLLSTIDDLKVRTSLGLVPISNLLNRKPVAKIDNIARVDKSRIFDVTADVIDGVNANAEIKKLEKWILEESPLPKGVNWEFTGEANDQAESQAFLGIAFTGALGLMFVILLAQFNSFYNSILVLLAVIMSTGGVLLGMLVMDQTFSVIMTGTGIVALAGIVVNNNIVLIDTYQQYDESMNTIQAIVRTVEDRIRPVLLTTITTMAGLTPMMFGLSLDFQQGGYTLNEPTVTWWKQLATAIVFGLGFATILTLLLTPTLLAVRYWIKKTLFVIIEWFKSHSIKRIQQPLDQ
ncbi:MAG: efflux RND transporter permease subunit [Paracoccaceae bacterium]